MGMSLLVGLRTKEFTLMCADQSEFLFGAISLKNDGSKAYKMTEHCQMMVFGQDGDPVQFAEFVQKNMELYKFGNGYPLGPGQVAHWARRQLANGLRSRGGGWAAFLLLGGFDKAQGGTLTSIDYLGTQMDADFLAQGFGGRFCLSILDALYRPDLTVDEAVELLKACLADVRKRSAIALPNFELSVVDKDGIRSLGSIRF